VVYKLRPAAEVQRDLDLIEDYLVETYQGFGEDLDGAISRALTRVRDALDYMDGFADHPHRGTEHSQIRAGLRSVTQKRFIYYFEIDEARSEVVIFAIFFGGSDHRRQISQRLKH
jgi:plasmid stabilization system protein ParE